MGGQEAEEEEGQEAEEEEGQEAEEEEGQEAEEEAEEEEGQEAEEEEGQEAVEEEGQEAVEEGQEEALILSPAELWIEVLHSKPASGKCSMGGAKATKRGLCIVYEIATFTQLPSRYNEIATIRKYMFIRGKK